MVHRGEGLNAFLTTASTASSAPVVVATRLRKGSAHSARGAARLVADALVTTRSCGVAGTVVLRADSAFYGPDVITAARRAGARFSITARQDNAVTAPISSIPDNAWTTIRYPKAVFDNSDSGCQTPRSPRPVSLHPLPKARGGMSRPG